MQHACAYLHMQNYRLTISSHTYEIYIYIYIYMSIHIYTYLLSHTYSTWTCDNWMMDQSTLQKSRHVLPWETLKNCWLSSIMVLPNKQVHEFACMHLSAPTHMRISVLSCMSENAVWCMKRKRYMICENEATSLQIWCYMKLNSWLHTCIIHTYMKLNSWLHTCITYIHTCYIHTHTVHTCNCTGWNKFTWSPMQNALKLS